MFGGFTSRKPGLHKQTRLVWQLLCMSVLIAPLSLVASDERMDFVSERLENAVENEFIGAAVVGSYNAGEVQYRSFGRVSQDSATSPNETTLFEMGSISKVFTAALTQVLVDSEVLSWDSTVKSSLGKWNIVSGKVRNVTLRELATHSSGLPRLPLNWRAIDPLDPYLGYDTRMLQAFVGAFDPPQLEKKLAYSNLGFGLLGSIAAHNAEKSYSEALKELVLDPLGMNHTIVGIGDEARATLAQGFGSGAKIPNWNFEEAMAGAGGVLSTAEDMMQFIKRNVEADDSSIHKSLKQLQQVVIQPNQALAWSMQLNESGQPVYWHAGLTGGYACFVAISPEESKGWVLLTTSMHGGLVNEIGQSFFGKSQRPDQVDLSAFLGVYKIIQNMYMTVTERDGQLFAQATGQQEIPLTFVKEREFKFDPADMVLRFAEPRNGKSRSFNLHQGIQNMRAGRVEDRFGIPKREEIEIDKETLTDYPGIYQLAPRAVLSVMLRDGQLFTMYVGPSIPEHVVPIFAMENDRFFYKQTDAEVLFERDKEGKISSLTLFQNGKHKAAKIDMGSMMGTPSPANRPSRPGPPSQSNRPRH